MNELKTITTGKGTYDSFPDKTARAELTKKLARPETAQVGDYLRIKAIGADGTMEVEAVAAPTTEVPADPNFSTVTLGGDSGVVMAPGGAADAPVLALRGAQGEDASVRLSNVAAATDDRDAPNLGQIKALMQQLEVVKLAVVASLPEAGAEKTLYLVPAANEGDLYAEYLYINGAWEIVGSQRLDLTGYATESYVDAVPAVRYAEQTLTEEQQMQARANLGVYNKRQVREEILIASTFNWGSFWELMEVFGSLGGGDYKITCPDGSVYTAKGFYNELANAGVSFAYVGNYSLIPEGADSWGLADSSASVDCPVVWYQAVGAEDDTVKCAVASDYSANKNTLIHLYQLGNVVDAVEKIPGEYLPDDLLREADYKFDPTVYGLPVLELTGDTSPIAVSKDNKVTLDYVYGDRSGTCTLKGQGATSYKTAQALVNAGKAGKFNYTIKFDTAFEAKEGWGAQQKYCLKANFIDPTHSRNVCSCILWGMSVKARSTVPAELADLPNGGAIDGFPIVIMLNGEFHGLYTWNIPKDGWMFGLVEDAAKTQAIVGADDHTAATQFKEASTSGFEVEFVSDEDNAAWVETSLTRMISAVMNSDGSDLDTTVAQYLDWDSAIDHYIHTVVDKATDCVDKNYLLVTFDGVKWFMSVYDRDSIHGLNWDASGTTRPVSNVSFTECAATVRVYELIKRFKTDALKARYKELRGNILSESRIMQTFENFAWAIPSPVMIEDVKLYPTILGSGVNTIDQIGRFVRQRLETCDAWVGSLPAQETPPTTEPDEPSEGYTNLVPTSTDTDGSIFNGTGYKDNARLSSSGSVSSSSQTGSVVTGFIPYTKNAIIRMKGAEWLDMSTEHSGHHFYLSFYDSSKALVSEGYISAETYAGGSAGSWAAYDATTGITAFDTSGTTGFPGRIKNAAYFRLNAYGKGADLIVTVNEEITE